METASTTSHVGAWAGLAGIPSTRDRHYALCFASRTDRPLELLYSRRFNDGSQSGSVDWRFDQARRESVEPSQRALHTLSPGQTLLQSPRPAEASLATFSWTAEAGLYRNLESGA